MKQKLFYQVKGTLYRADSENPELIEIDEVFKDINPINARIKAFEFYQNYIDVFLQSLGQSYVNHNETLFWLKNFIKNKNESFQKIGEESLWKIDEDFDKGLFIYLITDEDDKFNTLEGVTIYNNKIQIHNLDYSSIELFDDLYSNLKIEFELYKINNFETKNYKVEYDFDKSKFITELNPTLRTPINFERQLF